MGLVALNVFPRSTQGKNANRRTRAAGRIPGVLYGGSRDCTNVEIDTVEFTKVMGSIAGSSVIFDLHQENTNEDSIALMRELQKNPVTDEVMHIDLFEIPRGEPITVDVKLEMTDESLAIKHGEAVLAQILDSVEVSCLPRELPESIPVSLEGLEVNDKVYVKDLTTPAGEIVSDPEAMILSLSTPTVFVEETIETEDEEGLEGAEDAEGEEGAEGEAADKKAGSEDAPKAKD